MISALAVVTTLVLAQAPQPAARLLGIEAGKSSVRYHLVHKLHKIDGESKQVEGKVALKPDGTVQAMVRISIASFDSGDSSRDSNTRDTLEAQKYPFVTYKGTAKLDPPASYPAKVKVTLEGVLDFHGRQRPTSAPIEVEFASPTEASATTHFQVSLDNFEIERPSLMFMKLDDACVIDVALKLSEVKP